MKNIKHNIILIATVLATTVANATVRTLNNNNPSPGQFITWGTVQAASAAGDTVYVSGSPLSYGDITVTVYNLCIIGTGHNPQKQNPLVSEFGIIDGTVGQIRIEGIKCKRIQLSPLFGVAQIFMSNSYAQVVTASTDGFDVYLYLNNNVIDAAMGGYTQAIEVIVAQPASPPTTAGLYGSISNNILTSRIVVGNYNLGFEYDIKNCNIFNNLFIGSADVLRVKDFVAGLFSNNIILGNNTTHGISTGFSSGVLCKNNIIYPNTFSPALPNSSGTIIANPLLVNYPCPTWNCGFSTAHDYHLQAGSPGKNAGTDGTDIGPYGGPYGATFTTYGEPSIPQMKQMNMPATVISGGSFNVNIISTVK